MCTRGVSMGFPGFSERDTAPYPPPASSPGDDTVSLLNHCENTVSAAQERNLLFTWV